MDIRSFLAFELPPDIRGVLERVSAEVRKSDLDIRWVRVENIHLTVIFMGSIDQGRISHMEQDIGRVCARTRAFEISVKGVGFFPDMRRPRVVWLGLDGELERLSRFRDDLQRPLARFGIKEEKRPFRPHLTLGRFRKRGSQQRARLEEIVRKYGNLKSPPCSVEELVLFKSDLKPTGAEYTKLASWPLGGGSA
ncbi:MAG: RNA 2',3'-cyclic phosphodiesterase [Deltaproteobacteria bacterium]|nr:RNA 2',3'-cyclic phosphodiesterase [Deltaproteobacteria bacterium]MBW2138179.1 RNA 2',3'-cyclic phosphodiesterase [Deltaproteobacteria bacterium]